MGRAEALERILGGGADGVAVSLFDGSRVGPADAPVTIDVRSERALAYLATASGRPRAGPGVRDRRHRRRG